MYVFKIRNRAAYVGLRGSDATKCRLLFFEEKAGAEKRRQQLEKTLKCKIEIEEKTKQEIEYLIMDIQFGNIAICLCAA